MNNKQRLMAAFNVYANYMNQLRLGMQEAIAFEELRQAVLTVYEESSVTIEQLEWLESQESGRLYRNQETGKWGTIFFAYAEPAIHDSPQEAITQAIRRKEKNA